MCIKLTIFIAGVMGKKKSGKAKSGKGKKGKKGDDEQMSMRESILAYQYVYFYLPSVVALKCSFTLFMCKSELLITHNFI